MNIYGIPNCNSVKKAIDYLRSKSIDFEFHDFKKKGVTQELLNTWCDTFGWETVLNKKGLTWKKLSKEEQTVIQNKETAIEYLINNTSAIKRPIAEINSKPIAIGFSEEVYSKF